MTLDAFPKSKSKSRKNGQHIYKDINESIKLIS